MGADEAALTRLWKEKRGEGSLCRIIVASVVVVYSPD